MRHIFRKINDELSEEKPDLDFIKKELDKLEEEYNDLEWQNQELEDQVSELESDVDDLQEELKEMKQVSEEEHTLDDYFLDKILSDLRYKWRFSSTKLEQKLKESDII